MKNETKIKKLIKKFTQHNNIDIISPCEEVEILEGQNLTAFTVTQDYTNLKIKVLTQQDLPFIKEGNIVNVKGQLYQEDNELMCVATMITPVFVDIFVSDSDTEDDEETSEENTTISQSPEIKVEEVKEVIENPKTPTTIKGIQIPDFDLGKPAIEDVSTQRTETEKNTENVTVSPTIITENTKTNVQNEPTETKKVAGSILKVNLVSKAKENDIAVSDNSTILSTPVVLENESQEEPQELSANKTLELRNVLPDENKEKEQTFENKNQQKYKTRFSVDQM